METSIIDEVENENKVVNENENENEITKINTILFGFGRAGKIHYNNLIHNPKFNLTDVIDIYDISKELNSNIQFVNYNNKNIINSLMTDVTIEAVIIASPTSSHYELIKLSLLNNKHVFVEKPVTDNYDEINECFDLAESTNLTLFVAYNRRFDPTIMEIKDKIHKNEIGTVKSALTISRDYPYPTKEYLKISSGIFHDCATHDIDYVNWILNDKPISVGVTTFDNKYVEDYNYDYVLVHLKYSIGTIVCLNLSRVASSYDQRCEFYGDYCEIINNNFEPNTKLSFPDRYKEAYKSELDYFYNCVNKNIKSSITREECLTNYIIAEACHEAINKNKTITIKYGEELFRNYDMASKAVKNNYLKNRQFQTLEFVKNMHSKYTTFDMKIDIWEILLDLNDLVDVSDPDSSHPNLYHAFQTAEEIRKNDLPDWMQLIGLIHDMGKIMYKKGNDMEGTGRKEQWAMVGDTFVVGCKLSDRTIYPEYNKENPDMNNDMYNTEMGIYSEACGLDNVYCSWGHDEYLYQILTSDKNPNSLPSEALYMVRFHSLYCYHDKLEYSRFQSQKDIDYFDWLKKFNKYDLYSKCDDIYELEQLKPYYSGLINKYFKNTFLYI